MGLCANTIVPVHSLLRMLGQFYEVGLVTLSMNMKGWACSQIADGQIKFEWKQGGMRKYLGKRLSLSLAQQDRVNQ